MRELFWRNTRDFFKHGCKILARRKTTFKCNIRDRLFRLILHEEDGTINTTLVQVVDRRHVRQLVAAFRKDRLTHVADFRHLPD